MKKQLSFEEQRRRMVEVQLIKRNIHDPRLLQAMVKVPRHRFVPPEDEHLAYSDGPLPIGNGQTISQPYVVALMVELLGLQGDEKVLEIGTGSGYQAAILGHLAKEVHTVEIHEELAHRAEITINELGLANVHIHHADGSAGLREHGPYEGILVSAAAPKAPKSLLAQLTEGGMMVLPVGSRKGQKLQRWVRGAQGYDHEEQTHVSFVPLRGEFGWQPKAWPKS
jgi:protein-L-isoaspartate(D-aspartate) O-methyltransferase